MRNFYIICTAVLFSTVTFAQSLSGSYIIKSSNAAPFNNLANALARINSVGISSSVTFLLDEDQTSQTPYIIGDISGSSTTKTFTIKPNIGKTISITVSSAQAYIGVPAVIKIAGSKNVIIDGSNSATNSQNLTLVNANIPNYHNTTGVAVVSTNSEASEFINIKNLKVTFKNRNQPEKSQIGIYVGGDFSSDFEISNPSKNQQNITIENNVFSNIRQGIYTNGINKKITGLALLSNTIAETQPANFPNIGIFVNNAEQLDVTNNTIKNLSPNNTGKIYGLYLESVSTYVVNKNTISNITNTLGWGSEMDAAISVNGNSKNGTISNNKILKIKSTNGPIITGLYLASTTGNTATTIHNNYISDIYSRGNNNTIGTSASAIRINSGDKYKIYYNTLLLKSTSADGPSSGSVMSIATIIVQNSKNIVLQNNIIGNQNTNGGVNYSIYCEQNSNSTFDKIDYNNYYVNAGEKIGYKGADRVTFANWKAATNQDQKSKNVVPSFTNDLHLKENNTNNETLAGIAITNITKDYDGDSRQKPYMGADEILPGCASTTIWQNGTWSNLQPTDGTKKVIIKSNYTANSLSTDIYACTLEVVAGVTLTIAPNHFVNVNSDVSNAGTIFVQNSGSFLQESDDSLYKVVGNGSFVMQRQTTPIYRYDFTYWGSPLTSDSGYTLANLSPTTLEDKFYKWDINAQSWATDYSGLSVMKPGLGYAVRAPQTYSTDPNEKQVYIATFTGKPNNSVVTVPFGGESKINLISNPYASAINIEEFLLENSDEVDGTAYYWTHKTNTSNSYEYSGADYATYNLTGSTGVSAPAEGSATTNKPTKFVASAQGFFIKASTAFSTEVRFTNSMRVTAAGTNANFYKTNALQDAQKGRVWLNLSGINGAFNQMLVGYMPNATDGLDWGYDGEAFGGNKVQFYSIIEGVNLGIQGRSKDFTINDKVVLGYESQIEGQLTISIDEIDGILTEQDIFIEDKIMNVIHNLKEGNYTFSTSIGTFNDRFVLRYSAENTELGTLKPVISENAIEISTKNRIVNIQSSSSKIDKVSIYNLEGKLLVEKLDIQSGSFSSGELSNSSQILVVKVATEDGTSTIKKVLLN